MRIDWKKALKTTFVLTALGAMVAILSNKNKNGFEYWVESASADELSDGYEQRRQQWISDGFGGTGEKTPEMKQIDMEMSRRTAEKWENDPHRNTDPYYRWTDANRWDKE